MKFSWVKIIRSLIKWTRESVISATRPTFCGTRLPCSMTRLHAQTERSREGKEEWTDVRLTAILIQGNYESHLSWEGRMNHTLYKRPRCTFVCTSPEPARNGAMSMICWASETNSTWEVKTFQNVQLKTDGALEHRFGNALYRVTSVNPFSVAD